jgi:hypothetical protein
LARVNCSNRPSDGFSESLEASRWTDRQVAELFKKYHDFAIAIAPEGTRKKVEKLKTGFYFIAAKAGVPIIMVGLDYKNKTCRFSEPLYPSEQIKDFETIHGFYRTIEGKIPELGLMGVRKAEIHTAESTE